MMKMVFRNGGSFVGGAESETLGHPFSHCTVVRNDLVEYIGKEFDLVVTKALMNGTPMSDKDEL